MKKSSTKFSACRVSMEMSVVRRMLFLLCFMVCAALQGFSQSPVSGIVKDDAGTPVPGVNVVEKGTSNGSSTDAQGKYTISVNSGATLVFSFIGFKSVEMLVGSQTAIDIKLEADVTALSEVVVVGYGEVRKSDLTGAVSSVKPGELTKTASSDITQQLQGRVAGVSVTSDGQPGANPTVRIRGLGTFGTSGATTEPLYVVDGVPLAGGIRDFNPSDVETIQVLKDASAGAIYGSRAANGVIIITTKRGTKDRPLAITLNSYIGVQNVAKRIPVTNRVQYQMLNNEQRANNPLGPLGPLPGNDPNSPSFIDNIDTDWQKESYKQGVIQDHSINFTTGGPNGSTSVTLDYFKNTGTLSGNVPNYERMSGRVNSEFTKGIFKVGESIYLVHSNENPLYHLFDGFGGVDLNEIIRAAPTIPLYDPNRIGGYGGADAVIHNSITLNVPGMNHLVQNSTKVDRFFGNVYAELKLLNNSIGTLSYRVNTSYDFTLAHDARFIPLYDLGYFFPNANARAQNGIRQYTNGLIENTLTFDKIVGKHVFKVLAGQTYQSISNYNLGGSTSLLTLPYQPYLSNGKGTKGVFENSNTANIFSALARLNYAYDDRYLLTANVRSDGSSNISTYYRTKVFPSVAVAWKLHNEKFMPFPEVFSELKLRASYGQLGNQNFNSYGYQNTINQNIGYSFDGGSAVLGGANTVIRNPRLRWEVRTTRNIGLDGSLFDGKLDFTFEYYSNTASDILLDAPIPSSSGSLPTGTGGTASIVKNAASMTNSGFELSFTYRKVFGDFSIEVSPNAYTLKNRVTKLNDDRAFLIGTGSRTQVGHEVGSHYGWVYEGIFQTTDEVTSHATQAPSTGPGDIKFKDINNDGVIDDNDRTYLGKSLPSLYYGLNITAKYRNFDFTVFGSGSGGNVINNGLNRGLMSSYTYNNYSTQMLDRWTPEHTNTTVPRLVEFDFNNNGRDSNRPGWLEKGNYFRINTVSLGYSIPASLVKGVNGARFYVTCQNLYTFTSYKGFNPDFASGPLNPGFDGGSTGYGSYPKPRTFMAGVQLRF